MFIYEYGDKNDPLVLLLALMKNIKHGKASCLRKDIESSNWFDGAVVIRFLAAEDIPVEKAVIDAGIASHLYPKLIFVKDWIMIMLGTGSLRTIYNVFWSMDNYSMPNPVPRVDTKTEYWYGEEEKRAREKEHDIEFVRKAYPQTIFNEFKGLACAELVMMFP